MDFPVLMWGCAVDEDVTALLCAGTSCCTPAGHVAGMPRNRWRCGVGGATGRPHGALGNELCLTCPLILRWQAEPVERFMAAGGNVMRRLLDGEVMAAASFFLSVILGWLLLFQAALLQICCLLLFVVTHRNSPRTLDAV